MGTRWKEQVRMALEGDHPVFGRMFVFLLQGLIVFSALSIGIETLPGLPPWTNKLFAWEEVLIIAAFTVEYVLRIVTTERPLAYMRSIWGIIDLAAILPFYLSLGLDFRAVRTLTLLRIFQVMKLGRYSEAAARLGMALRSAFDELLIFGLAAVFILYVCSICIYFFEHDAQPEAFSSVFASMWWAAVTLTTVGYGDVYPITTGGRIFTVLMLLLALGVIAVPTGIVASVLSQLRRQERGPK